MAAAQVQNQFEQHRKEWNEYDFGRAFRDELGQEAYARLRPIVARTTEILNATSGVKDDLSNDIVHNVGNYAYEILHRCKSLAAAKPDEFIRMKEHVGREIEQSYNGLLQAWPSVLAVHFAQPEKLITEAEAEQKRLEQAREQARLLNEKIDRATRLLGDLEVKLDTVGKASSLKQESVRVEEAEFRTVANKFKRESWIWLSAVVVASVVFLCVMNHMASNFCFEPSCYLSAMVFNFEEVCKDCNRSVLHFEIVKAAAYRVLWLTFLLFIIGVALRNYNAAMHNYTVNLHKANSLQAARVMLGLRLTDKGSDELLVMAASSIFTHQSTGYNRRQPVSPLFARLLGEADAKAGKAE